MATKKGTIRTPIWSDERKRWKLDVQINGKRKSFYSSTPGRAGAKECYKKAEAWEAGMAPNGDTRVKDICDAFVEDLKTQRSPSSAHWRKHESICRNWIKPRIGMRRMNTIQDIQPLQEILYDAFDAGLCKRSIANIRTTIVDIFKYARLRKATLFDPEGLTVSRYAPTKGRPALRVEDVVTLMQNDLTLYRGQPINEPFINAWRFAAIMGWRPGEIIGLKHENINGDIVTIAGTINSRGERTRGKNQNALRRAKLPPVAQKVLQQQRDLMDTMGIKSEYVFANTDGGPVSQSTYRHHWEAYRSYHGIQEGTTPYSLRNTAISAYKAIPKPLLDPVIGHSKTMDTWGVYGRELDGDLDIVAREMQDAFSALLERGEK